MDKRKLPKNKEHKLKISQTLLNHLVSNDTKEKISKSLLGKYKGIESPHWKNDKARCQKCNKVLANIYAKICGKCRAVKKSFCKDCGKQVRTRTIRCQSCYVKTWKNKKCHPNWRGGLIPLGKMIRLLDEYINWRKQVFQRDEFKCQKCGVMGGWLEAHHKKEFIIILREFLQKYNQFSPIEDKETLTRLTITYEPFWDINNGETLCSHCHYLTKFVHKIIKQKG